VFFIFIFADAPGKWVEVDLVYPNIYIDMLFFSLSALVMNRVYTSIAVISISLKAPIGSAKSMSKGPP
jgi:hypothetical protein